MRFVVTFKKRVCGDNGFEVEATQGVHEVAADDGPAALELAKADFCNSKHISHWSLNADKFTVEEAEFSS